MEPPCQSRFYNRERAREPGNSRHDFIRNLDETDRNLVEGQLLAGTVGYVVSVDLFPQLSEGSDRSITVKRLIFSLAENLTMDEG